MAKLNLSKADIETLLQFSPAVHFITKSTGDFGATFISESVREQLGYEPYQFTEDTEFWVKRIHDDDRPRVLANMDDLLNKGHDVLEYRFLAADGSWRWMHDEMRVVRDKENNPL